MGEINGKSNFEFVLTPAPPITMLGVRGAVHKSLNIVMGGSGGGRGTQNKNVSVSVAMVHCLPDITHAINGGV